MADRNLIIRDGGLVAASAADVPAVFAGTSDSYASVKIWQDAQKFVTVPMATAVAGLNFSQFRNAYIEITTTTTFGAPTGMQQGQTGIIRLKLNAAWSVAFNSQYFVPAGFTIQQTLNGITDIPYSIDIATGRPRLYMASKWTS